VNALSLPGIGRCVIGRDLIDSLALPNYPWPCLTAARVAS
jgi:hypothetical protein